MTIGAILWDDCKAYLNLVLAEAGFREVAHLAWKMNYEPGSDPSHVPLTFDR